jgi:hypothetical protein
MDIANLNSLSPIMLAIGNFGFPLVLATYLLLRFEKKIENLTSSITELKEVIHRKS